MTTPPTIPPVTRVYVATCRRDLHLTRLCLASIRYWHPEIPISLVVDDQLGRCDTRRLERNWNAERFPCDVRRFGVGASKLEMLFQPQRERYLVLDSDIVLLGPILDLLNATSGDFVVHPEIKTAADLARATYEVKPLAKFDPAFVVPRYVFNSGQYVATSGLLRREDFAEVVEWTEPRRSIHPEIFKNGEQGYLNYVLVKAERAGRLSLTWEPIFLWRGQDSSEFTVEKIAARATRPMLLHWAGYRPDRIELMERADVLSFYDEFASRPAGGLERLGSTVRRWFRARPSAKGALMEDIPASWLKGFHDIERSGEVSWRWTKPEASITLPMSRRAYTIRIETGSPQPMDSLASRHLRFSLNGRALPPECVRISGGRAEVALNRQLMDPSGSQVLALKMDRLSAEGEERELGMPISVIRISRRWT